jgi:hypothetical protein
MLGQLVTGNFHFLHSRSPVTVEWTSHKTLADVNLHLLEEFLPAQETQHNTIDKQRMNDAPMSSIKLDITNYRRFVANQCSSGKRRDSSIGFLSGRRTIGEKLGWKTKTMKPTLSESFNYEDTDQRNQFTHDEISDVDKSLDRFGTLRIDSRRISIANGGIDRQHRECRILSIDSEVTFVHLRRVCIIHI